MNFFERCENYKNQMHNLNRVMVLLKRLPSDESTEEITKAIIDTGKHLIKLAEDDLNKYLEIKHQK